MHPAELAFFYGMHFNAASACAQTGHLVECPQLVMSVQATHLVHLAIHAGSLQPLQPQQRVQVLYVVPRGRKHQRRRPRRHHLPQQPQQRRILVLVSAAPNSPVQSSSDLQ